MTNEIKKADPPRQEISLATPANQDWQVMKEQAQVMIKSGFLPPSVRTPEQCIAIFMTGKELGIGFMEAIRSINVIQGKPTISPQLMLALANRGKEVEDVKVDANDQRAIVTIKRKGRSAVTVEFGSKEATSLGLMGKDNYKKQPKTMFTWRAFAANLRLTFPDVVLGLYTPEELGADVDVNDEGEMKVQQTVKINLAQAQELHTAARAKQIPNDRLLAQLGIQRLGDLTVDRLESARTWIGAQPAPGPSAEQTSKAYDSEVEQYVRAGVSVNQLGDYVETLPFANDPAKVVENLRQTRECYKADKLAAVIKMAIEKAKVKVS